MQSSYRYKILIVGDSRLRHLGRYLNCSPNFDFEIRSMPGAKIEEIGMRAMANLSYEINYDLVLFVGGIIDVTKIRYYPLRHATLRYANADNTCSMLMSQLYSVSHRISVVSDTPMVVATIPGMNLVNYTPEIWYRLLHFQPTLDRAMVEINRRIRGLNRSRNLPTLNLAYPVHRCAGRRGKYYLHYAFLHDGLHPGNLLLERWANMIVTYCVGHFWST